MEISNLQTLFQAAQKAMSTAVLSQGQFLDLSRLTLLGLELKVGPVAKEVTFAKSSFHLRGEDDLGKHFTARLELCAENVPVGYFEFHILSRKRGLRTEALRNIQKPGDFFRGEETGGEALPNPKDKDSWSVESLLFAALAERKSVQPNGIAWVFRLYDSASADLPCQIRKPEGNITYPHIVEVIQDKRLIAQLIEKNVL